MAMESPSHPGLRATVEQSGLSLRGCAVDHAGLRVDHLKGLHADAVVVAPAHQFPSGAVMSAERRAALIRWAARGAGRLIIEDDYDAEFRYDRAPVGALQGLDPDRVAHVGSASKTLAPAIRLGWVSCPRELVPALQARKSATDSGSPVVDQLALAHLLVSGAYERHVVRLRHTYRRRRDLLLRALGTLLPTLPVHGPAAGMQLVLELPAGVDDTAVSDHAAAKGINLPALSSYHLTPSEQRGVLLGFGRMSERQIEPAANAVAAIIRQVLRSCAVR